MTHRPPFVVTATTIDHVFERLGIRYGDAWIRKFENVEDVTALRNDWQHQLRMLSANAIAYGLDNLPPTFPPNVTEFRAICLAAPRTMPALAPPAPKRDPARVKAILEQYLAQPKPADGLAWARRLRDLDAAREPDPETGLPVSPWQRQAYRAALARHQQPTELTA